MTGFDERESAAEGKFALDEETMFKAHARRDRKLGLWAAGLMGKSAGDAAAYAEALIDAEIGGGEGSVAARVSKDLAASGNSLAATQVAAKMQELLAASLMEIKTGA